MRSGRPEVTNTGREFHEFGTGLSEPGPAAAEVYHFGPFTLRAADGRIFRDGRIVPLPPKPCETLTYLVRSAGRVVSKRELMDAIWRGTFVTDDVLVQCVVDIRRALGDEARKPYYIETVPRRGYSFVAPLTAGPPNTPQSPVSHAQDTRLAPLPALASGSSQRSGRPARYVGALAVIGAATILAVLAGGSKNDSISYRRQNAGLHKGQPGSVAVLPLQMVGPAEETAWLRHGLAEMIRSELARTPAIQTVPRRRLAAAIREAQVDDRSDVSGDEALNIARSLKVARLIAGSFTQLEERFALSAHVIDVATGRMVAAASVKGQRRAELLDAVELLCRKLAGAWSEPALLSPASSSRSLAPPTRSMAAFQAYTEALEDYARGGRQDGERAEQKLTRAIAADPSFARAYVKKAEVQLWRQRWGYGDPDPRAAVRGAIARAEQLPEREQWLVAGMGALLVNSDPEQALNKWTALLRVYPTYAEEAGVASLVVDTCATLGRWDECRATAEVHLDSPSLADAERARLSIFLANAFRRKGEFDRAIRHATRALELWPIREGPAFLRIRTMLGRLLIDAGFRSRGVRQFEAVSTDSQADANNMTNAAWGYYMAGEPARAAALVTRAIELDPSYGNAFHLRAWLLMVAGDYARAAADFQAAYTRTPAGFGAARHGILGADLAALYYMGVAAHKLGDPRSARATWRQVIDRCRLALRSPDARLRTPMAKWEAESLQAIASARLGLQVSEPVRLAGDDASYYLQSARLHAVQGYRERAVQDLRQALSAGAGNLQHVQDDPNFEALRSHPEFLRLVTSARPLE